MGEVTNLVLGALATYRLTRLLTEDTILDPYRDAVYAQLPPHNTHLGAQGEGLLTYVPNPAYILSCPHCASMYAAAATTLLAALAPRSRAARAVLSTLALAAPTSLLQDYVPRRTSSW